MGFASSNQGGVFRYQLIIESNDPSLNPSPQYSATPFYTFYGPRNV